jgi:sugar lactone lactonase YvrE
MKKIMWVLIGAVMILSGLYGAVRLTFGGGKPYPNVAGAPTIAPERVGAPIETPFPPGMVAHSRDGRVFYTYHMLHKPERFSAATVFEWREGKGAPFPNADMQKRFVGAMGISADAQGRLWIVKPGALAGKQTELLAIDIATGALVSEYVFPRSEAGFAQDMRVSPDGATVYLADTGVFRFSPASLIVFDVARKTHRIVLKGHESVSAQDWVIRKSNGKDYKLAFGALTFLAGVDGVALTQDGEWLYYATMSHDSLYRVPTRALRDQNLSDVDIAKSIEFVGKKPMSDGIELLADNTVIITDVENGGLAALSPGGALSTLTRDPNVNWADSVSVAPDGSIWFTDSRLTDLIDQFATPSDEAKMRARGPYKIYRIAPQ